MSSFFNNTPTVRRNVKTSENFLSLKSMDMDNTFSRIYEWFMKSAREATNDEDEACYIPFFMPLGVDGQRYFELCGHLRPLLPLVVYESRKVNIIVRNHKVTRSCGDDDCYNPKHLIVRRK